MSLTAITREVSPSINRCEVSFVTRHPIDLEKARAQHQAYNDCLAELGAAVIALPAEPDLPDSVFVEDTAVVLDELAIITNIGATSRRPETQSIAQALGKYRELKFIKEPGTLDGGDVLRAGRSLFFVGVSGRSNREGIDQLRELLQPYGYTVQSVEVTGCLHLKSACSYIGRNTLLVNRSWIDAEQLHDFDLLDLPDEEPHAGNVLLLNEAIVMPRSFPKTRQLLESHDFPVRTVDVSELQKAEAGVTCCSLIFTDRNPTALVSTSAPE